MDAVQTSPSLWAGEWSLDQSSALTAGTLVDHLGIRFVAIAQDAPTAEMVVGERTSQRMGYLRGGASLAMAETVESLASQMAVDREQFAALGLDINANHVRPVAEGELVRAIAKPLYVGRQTHVWEVRHESSIKLICIARLTTWIQARRNN